MMFMLGEYVAVTLICALTTILFLGGWLPPIAIAPFTWVPGIIWFVLKVCFVFFMFAMVKAIVPRYRYDQLMRLGWKVFLPISLVADRRRRCRAAGDRLGRGAGGGVMMSLALIGALVGLAFAAVEYVLFGALLDAPLQRNEKGAGPAILDLVRKAQIILFPIIGYFAGSLFAGQNGGS